MHAAADYEHRRLKAGAILQIQTIVDSHQAGGKHYDFWGITTSEDPKHPWYGFTQYKKTFGGHQVDYTGTYDIILKPTKYRIYTVLRKINRTKRLLLSKRSK
jgi:lipid II:glycine glycyltransferase (peptidoglycan interpeptide bridge formation enzyme)